MSSYTTSTWGYKILSDNKINFYHVLLPKIDLSSLTTLPSIHAIKQQKDGSITISVNSSASSLNTVDEIVQFFSKKEQNFLDTPNYYYKVDTKTRQSLLTWGLAFQGCLALLLQFDSKIQEVLPDITFGNWQFINAATGGLYLEPYTVLLYESYPKVIHPVSVANYEARNCIEQTISSYIRKMLKHMQEAQPGLEGLALISMVEEKTKLSQKEITKIINDKSFGIKTPTFSPFFVGTHD